MRNPISSSRLTVAASAFALFLAACDDDKTPNQTGTAGTTGTAGSGGSSAGAGGTGGATTGTGGGGGTAGTGGTAAAFIDTDVVLARFNADGTLDTTFGTQGVARVDLGTGAPVGGRDTPWGIAQDEKDRLHVFAARKNIDGRTDADRVVARLSPNGVLDTTFGDAIPMQTVRTGIHTLNIGNVSDSVRNGIVQADGKIVTSGYYGQPTGIGPQTANRLVIARLHGGDAPVTAGTGGGSTGGTGGGAAGGTGGAAPGGTGGSSAGGTGGGATGGTAGGAAGGTGGSSAGGTGGGATGGTAGGAAGGTAGGAAGGTGGSSAGGTGGGAAGGTGGGAAPQPGTFDTTFGVGGIASANPFSSTDGVTMWGMAEAYGVTRQSTGAYVTAGYGRLAPSGQVNVVSFRFTSAGVFDTTWATNGIFERDLTSANDRGRNIVTLPQDRLMIVGSAVSGTIAGGDNVDGMIMILTPNGALDTTFNTTGYKIYKFDTASDRGDESLYGAAVSTDGMFAVAAGYRNSPRPATATVNDDAVLVILPLGGTGTEVVKVVPFSTTADDRFWAVTFDGNNKIVATGYVTEGTDNFLAVARFNTDGTRDTTFGTGGSGMAKINAIVGGNLEEARGVVVQSSGKIVIGGSAEH